MSDALRSVRGTAGKAVSAVKRGVSKYNATSLARDIGNYAYDSGLEPGEFQVAGEDGRAVNYQLAYASFYSDGVALESTLVLLREGRRFGTFSSYVVDGDRPRSATAADTDAFRGEAPAVEDAIEAQIDRSVETSTAAVEVPHRVRSQTHDEAGRQSRAAQRADRCL